MVAVRILFGLLCLTGLCAGEAGAQAYPTKQPIRLVIGYPPGGGADFIGRIVAQKLSERIGQQIIVINTAGASGAMAAAQIAHTDADGYTILLATTAEMSIIPNITSHVRYDPLKDFAPITQLTSYAYILVVNPALPFKSLAELIAYARSNPGALNYGTPGLGSGAHMTGELFAQAAGIKLTHIPFRGAGPALQAVVAGQIQVGFGDVSSATPLIESGQLRALAVTAGKRSQKFPDVPTFAQAGVPGYEVAVWHGLFAPAGTPHDIVKRLSKETAAVLALPELRERFGVDGIELVGSTPAAFAGYLRQEYVRWGRVARDANIKID